MAGFGYDPIDEFDTMVLIVDLIFSGYRINIQKIQLAISTWNGTAFNEDSVRSFLYDIGCINLMNVSFQAGGLERARKLPKIQDADKESMFGYVHAVSGPGKFKGHQVEGSSQSKPLTN